MDLLIIAIGMIVLAAFAVAANGIGRGLPRLLGRPASVEQPVGIV